MTDHGGAASPRTDLAAAARRVIDADTDAQSGLSADREWDEAMAALVGATIEAEAAQEAPAPEGLAAQLQAEHKYDALDLETEYRRGYQEGYASAQEAPAPLSAPLRAALEAFRVALERWVPQHTSSCAAQDDDAECICGTSEVFRAALKVGRLSAEGEAE